MDYFLLIRFELDASYIRDLAMSKVAGTETISGAGDEARTRNFQLGKLTLYH